MITTEIALETHSELSFNDAVDRCREALLDQGFGVLATLDFQATLQLKTDTDIGPYLVLAACHPASAAQALRNVPEIGVLLPCNVCISVENGTTIVRAVNPISVMGMVDNEAVEDMAHDIASRLRAVLTAVGPPTPGE